MFADAGTVQTSLAIEGEDLVKLQAHWNDLCVDEYIEGDYKFRSRRYSQIQYIPETQNFTMLENVPYNQPKSINSYVGGVDKNFEPMTEKMFNDGSFRKLISTSFAMFDIENEYLSQPWTIETHVFRLTAEGTTETTPTPEGIHRDGIPLGALHLIDKDRVEGGISHIYTLDEELLAINSLNDALQSFYCWDNRVKHYATPFWANTDGEGHRDILVYGFHLPNTKYERK